MRQCVVYMNQVGTLKDYRSHLEVKRQIGYNSASTGYNLALIGGISRSHLKVKGNDLLLWIS